MPHQPTNSIVDLCREHLQMRIMIEQLLLGLITPAAWEKKYKDFSCDTEVEMYVSDVLAAEEVASRPSHLKLVQTDRGEP